MTVSKSQLSFANHFVNKNLLVAKFGYPYAKIGPIVDCTNFKLCVELFIQGRRKLRAMRTGCFYSNNTNLSLSWP